MTTRSPQRARQRAFTLLELTIAVAMVAVLGLSLYSALAIAFRARDSARAQTAPVREASIALDVVQRELGSVVPADGLLNGPFIAYSGGSVDAPADTVEFHAFGSDPTAAPDDPLAEGVRRVQLLLRTDTDPPMLVRRVERNLLATVIDEPQEEILLTNVRGFDLRYFDGEVWLEEWDSTQMGGVLPFAVEVTLELNTPALHDSTRYYRITQVIPLSCATAPLPVDEEMLP